MLQSLAIRARAPWWPLLAERLANLAAAEQGRFAPWLAVSMGAGVLVYFGLTEEPAWWIGGTAALAALASAWLFRGVAAAKAVFAVLAAAAIGFGSCQYAASRALPVEPFPSRAVTLEATVRGIETLPAGRRVMLERIRITDSERILSRTVRVKLKPADATEIATGDRIRLRTLIRAPSPPAYPGGWDLQRDDFFAGLGGYGQAFGPVELVAHAPPDGFGAAVRRVRDIIEQRILAVLPGTVGGIAATLMTGITAAIPEPDRAAFRDSGLAHLLAVAGLHIGIVMGLVLAFTRLLLASSERASLFWPCKQIAAVFALAAGGFYMLLTGVHLPIMRSFAMACLFTLGVVAARRAISLRGLTLAAITIMLIEPWEVVGVSFQMSFSAVLALIAGYEALRPALLRLQSSALWGEGEFWRRFALHVSALALTSFLAGTASAPFGAYHFGRVQAYFVISNMIAVPLTAMFVMPAGLIALALMPFGLEALALVPMGWGVQAILWIAHAASDLPAATFAVPHIPGWGLAVLSLGIAWLGIWRTRWRLAGIAAIVLGLASPLFERPPDILVSNDARLIGLYEAGRIHLQKTSGGSAFVQDAWQHYWAADTVLPLIDDDAAGITCDPTACLLKPYPDRAAAVLLRREGERTPFCDDAAVLVAAVPSRTICRALPRVDRFTVWREGAAAIWLELDGARIITDRGVRGDRPWVPAPQSRRGEELPPAPTD